MTLPSLDLEDVVGFVGVALIFVGLAMYALSFALIFLGAVCVVVSVGWTAGVRRRGDT